MISTDIGFILTSKDNYSMLDEWLSIYDYSSFTILNIDAGSSLDSLNEGKEICKKHNVNFMQSQYPEMQFCLDQAANFFIERNINWFIYTHQDTYPLTKNFFEILKKKYLNKIDPSSIGMIGFNIYHDQEDLQHWEEDEIKYMTLARCPLELGDGVYSTKKTSRVDYNKFIKGKPFFVEIPWWTTTVFSAQSFKKYIEPDINFQFFLSIDDIALQFLKENIPNIAIPELAFAHDQSLKLKHKLPYKSPQGNSSDIEKLYGRIDYVDVWKSKWKFRMNDYSQKSLFGLPAIIRKIIVKIMNVFFSSTFLETIGRKEFSKVKNDYSNTLLDSFYNHDPKAGPMKYYEITK